MTAVRRVLLGLVFASLVVAAQGTAARQADEFPTANLVMNPGGETGRGQDLTGPAAATIPRWSRFRYLDGPNRTDAFRAVRYGSQSVIPTQAASTAIDGGQNLFTATDGTLKQDVLVLKYALAIDGGEPCTAGKWLNAHVSADVSGNAFIQVKFFPLQNYNHLLGSLSFGLPSGSTTLTQVEKTIHVPDETREIRIELIGNPSRVKPRAFFDNVSLVLEPGPKAGAAAGCAEQASPFPLTITGGSTKFGIQAVGSVTNRALRIKNTSGTMLTIGQNSVSGSAFDLTADTCSGEDLQEGESCGLTVQYRPTAVSSNEAGMLTLNDNGAGNGRQVFPLLGVAIAQGSAKVVALIPKGQGMASYTGGGVQQGNELLFPEQTASSVTYKPPPPSQTISYYDIGTTSATIDSVLVKGKGAADFNVTANGCANGTIAPGSDTSGTNENYCVVTVALKPGIYNVEPDAKVVLTGSHTGGAVPIRLGLTKADLAIANLTTSPLDPAGGEQITYSMDVKNTGPQAAAQVGLVSHMVVDDGDLSFLKSTQPSTARCGFDTTTDTFSCQLGDLASGASVPITATFGLPKEASRIENHSYLSSLMFDPYRTDNSKHLETAVKPAASADLAIQSLGATPLPARAGRNFNFAAAVKNRGPDDAENVTIAVTLGPDLEGISIKPPSGATCERKTFPGGEPGWLCTAGVVSSSDVVTFVAVLRPGKPGAKLSVGVQVNADTTDSNLGNNTRDAILTAAG